MWAAEGNVDALKVPYGMRDDGVKMARLGATSRLADRYPKPKLALGQRNCVRAAVDRALAAVLFAVCA